MWYCILFCRRVLILRFVNVTNHLKRDMTFNQYFRVVYIVVGTRLKNVTNIWQRTYDFHLKKLRLLYFLASDLKCAVQSLE